MRNLESLAELKKQGKMRIEERRDNFVRQSLLSDEFLDLIQRNKKPFDLLMCYYECAIMEVETKFKVLNQEHSLEYDRNPIESIKTRVKSYESILKKIRKKDIPITMEAIEENIKDIAGVRVICSFQDDVYRVAGAIKKLPGYELVKEKNYITKPKSSGYRSIHLILRPTKTTSNIKCIEVQVRSAAMNYWAILEHQLCYKNEKKGAERIRKELKECAIDIAKIDKKMLKLRKEIEKI